MQQGKNPPQVRFTLEPRQPTPDQLEAGKRLFAKLAARARASLSAARSDPNYSPGMTAGKSLSNPCFHSLSSLTANTSRKGEGGRPQDSNKGGRP